MGDFSLLPNVMFGAILLIVAVIALSIWGVAPRVSQRGRRMIRIFSLIGVICIVLLLVAMIFYMPSL